MHAHIQLAEIPQGKEPGQLTVPKEEEREQQQQISGRVCVLLQKFPLQCFDQQNIGAATVRGVKIRNRTLQGHLGTQ